MNTKVVVLNAGKVNYDGRIDFSILSEDTVIYEDSTLADVLPRIAGAAAIVTKEMVLPADLVRQFPESVRLIVEAGTGYNNIPLDAAKEKGITVCNIPAYSTQRVAHTAIMLLLALSSTLQVQLAMLQRGDRTNFTKCLQVPHYEVNGKTLGVIGAGHIGKEVMKVAWALDMEIIVYTRTPRQNEDHITYTDLETVLRQSDYVTLHCPLNDQTRHLINKERLALMKPAAFLINTSRGALIDEAALIDALQHHRIAGAGLDVQETEPPAGTNPLYTLENVILTPHMGWKGQETRQRLLGIIHDDIRSFFAGTPINVVSQ